MLGGVRKEENGENPSLVQVGKDLKPIQVPWAGATSIIPSCSNLAWDSSRDEKPKNFSKLRKMLSCGVQRLREQPRERLELELLVGFIELLEQLVPEGSLGLAAPDFYQV